MALSAAGFNVVCLEQGDWQQPDSYPPLQADWEFRGATSFAFDPNIRGWREDYPVDNTQSDITPLLFNAVGGSTIHWTAHAPRLHPSDFRVKSLDGVADDWPISYSDLEKYYDLNDVWMVVRVFPAIRPTGRARPGRCRHCLSGRRGRSMRPTEYGHSDCRLWAASLAGLTDLRARVMTGRVRASR